MESDRTMDEGVGMQLLLEGKKTLTIGVDALELSGADASENTCGGSLLLLIITRPCCKEIGPLIL